jgi:transcriptional regulator with XRE-family HTH domain
MTASSRPTGDIAMKTTDLIQNAKIDIANRISVAMERRGVNGAQLATVAGLSKGQISQILSGDGNLHVASIVKILNSLQCRMDIIVTRNCYDEHLIKRYIAQIEESLWGDATRRPARFT